MTNPLYHVGQHVAVCTPDCGVVIPKTVVRTSRYFEGFGFNVGTGQPQHYAGWLYEVDGEAYELREICLRPIDPDTEYTEEEEREVSL